MVLNKPAGYECSQKPKHHPSVYSLLPAPLRRRDVQPVGRLDEDTTGLLLLTDDGALIHRLTSPKHHVPKVYEVGCKHPVDAGAGRSDCWPASCCTTTRSRCARRPARPSARTAAAHAAPKASTTRSSAWWPRPATGSRRCTAARFGALALPADLAPGQWRWLDGPQAITAVPTPPSSSR